MSTPTPSDSEFENHRHVTPGPTEPVIHPTDVDPIDFLDQLIGQYGDVGRYQTRFGPCFFFRHPEHVKAVLHSENYRRSYLIKAILGNGLLASNGPYWRSERRLMQPEFMSAKVAPYLHVINKQCARTARNWHDAAVRGEPVDITLALTWVTLRVIAETMFSKDLSDQEAQDLSYAVAQAIHYQGTITGTVFGNQVQLVPDRVKAYKAAGNLIDAFCHEIIAERRAIPRHEWPGDLLTLLIEAHQASQKPGDIEIRDEIVTILVGGHETTAIALAWALKMIWENPTIESKLHAEVDAVVTEEPVTNADLSRLHYTQAVFQEALRLYPPVWSIVRVASEDAVIDGHAIPRNAAVIISAWFTHRHEEFWTEPQTFDPSRFMDPASKQRHRYAYFPFGGGRHLCMGIHFAMMEGVALLATLSRQFRIHPQNAHAIKPVPGITLRQSTGIMARLQRRTTSEFAARSEAV